MIEFFFWAARNKKKTTERVVVVVVVAGADLVPKTNERWAHFQRQLGFGG